MKKAIIISLIVIVIAVSIYFFYFRNSKPTLESYDHIKKIGCYKYQGKKVCLDLRTTGVRLGAYTVTPILSEVNITDTPIGSIIGIALRKDGVIIDKLTA
jgi:hypothetical protein